MDQDVEALISTFPELEVIKGAKRIRCTLSGHEFPYKAKEILNYTAGMKFKRLKEDATFPFDSYTPFIVPSEKKNGYLFCALTGKYINKVPRQLENHVKGLNYRYEKSQYDLGKKKLKDEVKKESKNVKDEDATNDDEGSDVAMEDDQDDVHVIMEDENDDDIQPTKDVDEDSMTDEDNVQPTKDIYNKEIMTKEEDDVQPTKDIDEDSITKEERKRKQVQSPENSMSSKKLKLLKKKRLSLTIRRII